MNFDEQKLEEKARLKLSKQKRDEENKDQFKY